ncbi:MAG TPA: hypothetical protein VFN71_01730 [Methylomirabilota bacterium]|nr:hypothetical protein [Methylomirabilota bacterium]
MIFRWALIAFAVATLLLWGLSKLLGWLHPPGARRPPPPWTRSLERTLRWSVLLPAALGLGLLALALMRGS